MRDFNSVSIPKSCQFACNGSQIAAPKGEIFMFGQEM